MKSQLLFIPILSILVAACGAQGTPTATPLPPVSDSLAVVADGRLLPAQSLDLSFAGPGQVAQVLVHEGDQVEAGQLLAQLKSADALQAQLKQAQAALVTAQNNLQSLKDGATHAQLQAAL